MTLAVAGATSSRSMLDASAMCSMSAFIPGANWLVMTGSRVMASNVSGPTKRRAVARQHRVDAVPPLLQQPRDLDRLVGADAAGDAEPDERHRPTRSAAVVDARHRARATLPAARGAPASATRRPSARSPRATAARAPTPPSRTRTSSSAADDRLWFCHVCVSPRASTIASVCTRSWLPPIPERPHESARSPCGGGRDGRAPP